MVTACKTLMRSSFSRRLAITAFDSSMASVPPPPIFTRLLAASSRAIRFTRVLRESRPDAVLLMCGNGLSFLEKAILARWARQFGVPVLLMPRAADLMRQLRRTALTRQFGRWLFHGASLVVCQGNNWREFLLNEMRLPGDCFKIVPNWTASPDLLALGIARASWVQRDTVTMLFLGWLDRGKGIFDLLEAVANLAADQALPKCRLLIAGEGTASEEARQWVTKRGLDCIEFLGWVRDDAKIRTLSAADIFVLPSWHEGLPNAMVEAMATGLPVVVTPVGAIPDTLRDGYDGVLVPIKDVAALTAALKGLLENPAKRALMGARAHATAAERFGVEPGADLLVELVTQAVRDQNRKKPSTEIQ